MKKTFTFKARPTKDAGYGIRLDVMADTLSDLPHCPAIGWWKAGGSGSFWVRLKGPEAEKLEEKLNSSNGWYQPVTAVLEHGRLVSIEPA